MLVWTGDDERLHLEALYYQLGDLAPKRILTTASSTSIARRRRATRAGEAHAFEEVITEFAAMDAPKFTSAMPC